MIRIWNALQIIRTCRQESDCGAVGESHLNPEVFVCNFSSGRLKFKQLNMKERIGARVRKSRLQKPSYSAVPMESFELGTKDL